MFDFILYQYFLLLFLINFVEREREGFGGGGRMILISCLS